MEKEPEKPDCEVCEKAEADCDCVQCYNCSTMELEENAQEVSGEMWCDNCYSNHSFTCFSCDNACDNGERVEHDGEYYCNSCWENHSCENCEGGGIPERNYSTKDLPRFQSMEAGQTITSQRIFSAEIECYYPDYSTMREVAEKLPHELGISHDGSLNENGVEFQTPKLKGLAGENTIKSICETLKKAGFHVDRDAGLHLHLDAPEFRDSRWGVERLKQMMSFYVVFEEVLLSFLPRSRRMNQYCRHLRRILHIEEIRETFTLEAFERLWYRSQEQREVDDRKGNKYDNSRYAGINFHSLLANGHMEVRYHSGTLDAGKILAWCALHQQIMDMACATDLKWSVIEDALSMTTLEHKTDAFFSQLKMPKEIEAYFRERQQKFSSALPRMKEEETPDFQIPPEMLEIITPVFEPITGEVTAQ